MDTPQYQESALITAAQRGDRRAFNTLAQRYQHRLYAVAYQYVGHREDALELCQESFIRAYRALGRFDTQLPLYPWLKRITVNTCLNYLKRKKRRAETSLDGLMEQGFDALEPRPSPRASAALGDVKMTVAEAMQDLSEEHRRILYLRHFLEYSYTEIAAAIDVPEGTVMSRLHAARKQLRKRLEGTQEALVNI